MGREKRRRGKRKKRRRRRSGGGGRRNGLDSLAARENRKHKRASGGCQPPPLLSLSLPSYSRGRQEADREGWADKAFELLIPGTIWKVRVSEDVMGEPRDISSRKEILGTGEDTVTVSPR